MSATTTKPVITNPKEIGKFNDALKLVKTFARAAGDVRGSDSIDADDKSVPSMRGVLASSVISLTVSAATRLVGATDLSEDERSVRSTLGAALFAIARTGVAAMRAPAEERTEEAITARSVFGEFVNDVVVPKVPVAVTQAVSRVSDIAARVDTLSTALTRTEAVARDGASKSRLAVVAKAVREVVARVDKHDALVTQVADLKAQVAASERKLALAQALDPHVPVFLGMNPADPNYSDQLQYHVNLCAVASYMNLDRAVSIILDPAFAVDVHRYVSTAVAPAAYDSAAAAITSGSVGDLQTLYDQLSTTTVAHVMAIAARFVTPQMVHEYPHLSDLELHRQLVEIALDDGRGRSHGDQFQDFLSNHPDSGLAAARSLTYGNSASMMRIAALVVGSYGDALFVPSDNVPNPRKTDELLPVEHVQIPHVLKPDAMADLAASIRDAYETLISIVPKEGA
ncbi:hypothetical protein HY990_02435 [Candidatus Micrarchaeota archaeon]|nr:hypothetical protein [Candidatus Micrarchaeota archaeon]